MITLDAIAHGFLHGSLSPTIIQAWPQIAFLGAGSVVFTRQLVADLLRFDDLPSSTLALHDIDAERLDVARGHRAPAGRAARARPRPSRRRSTAGRRSTGADFVVNMIQVGGIDATITDLEIPARYGLRQTIGDTTGVGGVFRALRTFPVLTGIARDMRGALPRRAVPQLHEPDGDERLVDVGRGPRHPARRAVPQRLLDGARPCRAASASRVEGTHYRAAGVNHQAWLTEWTRDGETLYPRLASAIERIPSSSAGCASRSSAASGTTRPRPASTRRSTCPGSCAPTSRSSASGSSRCEYIGISEDNVAEFEQAKAALAAGEPLPLEGDAAGVRPAGHPLDPDRHRARDPRQRRRTTGSSTTCPTARSSRCRPRRRRRGAPVAVGPFPSQGAALNRTYLSVAELTVRGRAHRRPAAWCARPCWSTRTRASTLTPAADLGAVRRAGRRPTATCSPSRCALGGPVGLELP